MKHLQIDKLFDDNTSLKIGYYEDNTFKFITSISEEKLHIMLNFWDGINKIVYRGFSSKSVDSIFRKYIFSVGDKGDHCRNRACYDSCESGTRYFSDHESSGKENYYYLLSKLQNDILPKYKHKEMIPNIETLKDRFEEYRINNKLEYEQMYYLLLVWLHNIGNATGLKYDSPLISTTTSLDTAFSFKDKNSQIQYAFVILLTESKISDYFDTNNLNKMLKEIDINWYENIHKEIMIKDSIFPHTMIGIIEKAEKETKLILNPNLLYYLQLDLKTEFIAEWLQKFGMRIDDTKFYEGAKKLGLNKTFEQDESGRKLFNEDGESHIVGEINLLNHLVSGDNK